VVPKQRQALIKRLELEMLELAKDLEFERAAVLRDEIRRLEELKAPKSPKGPNPKAPQRASKRT
jgi:excinuclease UvrABC helicase subunit UvrB